MTPTDPDPHTRYGLPLAAYAPNPTRCAIRAYIAYRDDPIMEPAPTPEQVRLVAEYLQEYIHAPLLSLCYAGDELRRLRREVAYIRTVKDLADWLWDCRAIGIEPV